MLEKQTGLTHENQYFNEYGEKIEIGSSLCLVNTTGIILKVTKKLSEPLQYKSKELVGKSIGQLMKNNCDFNDILKKVTDQDYCSMVIYIAGKNSNLYTFSVIFVGIYNALGNLHSLICLGQDVSESIRLNAEIIETQKELIYILGEIIENHSQETSLHIKRVALISELLARKYGLGNQHSEMIKVASSVHDIGKISIPAEILNKPGKLTEAEFQIIKKHPEIGFNLLSSSDKPLIKMAANIAYEHHEHFDGKGYPRGLSGYHIAIEARIVGLSDVFDALSNQRIYKAPWIRQDIEKYLQTNSGLQFDPLLYS